MSSTADHSPPPVSADVQLSHRHPPLPWCWPEGARVLLAVLAILAGIGLVAASRDHPRRSEPDLGASELMLDPNTATPEALAALPHLGPTLARRIFEARADGPFRSLEDVRARVRGIGPVTLAQIAPYLRIDSVTVRQPAYNAESIAIADASAGPGIPPGRSSRKPPKSKTRKSRAAPVQLVAKARAGEAP
jgi:competence protein ComEA